MSKKQKTRSRKKKNKGGRHAQKNQVLDRNATNWHHLLFQRRHWQNGYAKLLREHPYMGKYIPMHTIHRHIHAKIHDIPCPNGKDCKHAYQALLQLEDEGKIDIRHDSLEKRLDFLIDLWSDPECNCEATVAVLRWQREVVHKFYEKEGK